MIKSFLKFTYNNRRRRVFNLCRTQNIYQVNHMDRYYYAQVDKETSNCVYDKRERSDAAVAIVCQLRIDAIRPSSTAFGRRLTERASQATAIRTRGGTHSRSRDSQSRACAARTPAPHARPAPARHLTIDALYCINYLGNTQ